MDTTYKRVLFAFVACVAVCAVIYIAKATPTVPPVGTDMLCNGPFPEYIGTPDGAALGCWPLPAITAQVFGTRVQTDATGLYVWTFPAGCLNNSNIPYFSAVAEGPTPQGGTTVNPQVEGVPTATTVSFRVTKVSAVVVALIGLTVLSVPAQSATYLDLTCSPK